MQVRKRGVILCKERKKEKQQLYQITPNTTETRKTHSVTSIKVEFQRRDLSSTAVPSKPCRGHLSTTHLISLSHVWEGKSLSHIKGIYSFMGEKMWIYPYKDSPTYFCLTVKVLWQHFFFLQFHVWSWTLRTPESTRLLINAQWNWPVQVCWSHMIRASALNNLNVFERVDLRLRRAEDILRPRSCDLHQVQKPFPIFIVFGPLNVQWGFDRGLPQVVYLKEKSRSYDYESIWRQWVRFRWMNLLWTYSWSDFRSLLLSSWHFHPSQHLQKKPGSAWLPCPKQANILISLP